jgi:hypothetical protein
MGWDGEQTMDVSHATAFATSDPSIFSLEGLDFNTFLEDSPGEIELSMGTHVPFPLDLQSAPYAQLASLFDTYDYVDLNDASQTTDNTSAGPSRTISSTQIAAPPAFFSHEQQTPSSRSSSSSTVPQQSAISPVTSQSFFNHGSRTSSSTSSFELPQQQQIHTSYGQESLQQYFNFDVHSNISPLDLNTTPPRPDAPSHSNMISTMSYHSQRTSPPQPPQHTPYTPPSAVAHTGTRRVAASWKPPRPDADSPIEHSPTEMWPYPVSARS